MEFKDAVKYLRSELGLTQVELATGLHMNALTIGRWEQGKTLPTRSITSILLEYARVKGASKECLDTLSRSIHEAAKSKLDFSGDERYAVEQASLRQIIDDASFAVYVSDFETDEILFLNRKAGAMAGKDVSAVGMKCYECFMHRDAPCEFCHKAELTEDACKSYDVCRLSDGQIYHVQSKLISWNRRKAQIHYLSGPGIASEQQPPEAMDTSNRYKRLFESMNGGVSVVVFEDNGAVRLAYANERYYQLFGYTKEQLFKELKDSYEVIHPDDRDKVAAVLAQIKETKQAATFRYRIIKRDKSIAYVRCNSSAMAMAETSGYALISVLTDITESVKTEQQALVSGQRLDAIMKNMNSAVTATLVKNDGTVEFLFSNDLYHKMFGYTWEQFLSEVHDPCHLIHPDDVEGVSDAVFSLHRVGDVRDLQYRVVSRDGTIKWLRARISLMTFPDADEPIQLAIYADVTDIVEAQEKLAAQHDQIAELLNDTPSGIAIIELDPNDIAGTMHTVYYNDRFISYSGYDRDEYDALHKNNEMSFVYKEDVPALLRGIIKLCAGDVGASDDTTVRCHTKGGGFRWLLLTGQLTARRGDICVINVSIVDITQRKEAMDRQRISEEMLRIAAETDQRSMIVYDVKKNTCRAESRTLFAARFGETFENVPQSLIDMGLTTPESEDTLCSLFTRIRAGEANIRVSLQLHSGPDKFDWFECNTSTIFDSEGKPDHAVLVFHNITEQRMKEAVFKKWQQSIDARPAESYTLFRCNLSKDASLDEQDGALLKVSFPAEALSFNSRTRVYAEEFVCPDDRAGYIKLLDSDTLLAMYYRGEHFASLDYREIAANGETEWRRVTIETVEYPNSSDVQAFLMYEDVDEKKRAEIEAMELAKADPLTGALNRSAFAEAVDALIHENPNSPCALIMLDMDGFKRINDVFGHAAGDQALQEVVAVLRSYSRDGDLVCRLGGDEFMVWLRDVPYDAVIAKTAQQMCEHIKKAYSQDVLLSASAGVAIYPRDGQSYNALSQNADHALNRVKRSIKGSYSFYSAIIEDQPTQAAPDLTEAAPTARSAHSAKRRMLIVDDNEVNRITLNGFFKDEYLIEIAKNGTDALLRLRHFGTSISVVLLDLFMPGVDGFAVLKRMQSDAKLRTIPVIVVTADEDPDTLLKAFDLGAAEYVVKPVNADIIRMRVKTVINKAENERLRAQNSYLLLQRDEEVKYRTVLESTGTAVVEYDWRNHVFIYDGEMSKHIAGKFDHRSLWHILLSDMVGDSADVKALQDTLMGLAKDRDLDRDSKLVKFKTPAGDKHWFRVNYYKRIDDFGLADKVIVTFNDVHEEVLANDKLLFQATRDELTGLYNRAGFLEKTAELIAAREPGYYVMSCIDVEKFKVINDRYGTERGDEVLRHIAASIGGFVDKNAGICCRYTADKFAVLYPAKLLGTPELAENHSVASSPVCIPHTLRLCIGRCMVNEPAMPVSAIFDRAAMAKALAKGRYDTYIVDYDESMRDNILKEQQIVGDMVEALKNGEFEPWFQPQYNHSTGALIGAEALVRWRKDGTIIPPNDFVPVFEKNGFIYEVDQCVWRSVCILLRRWLDEGKNPLPVSVNISRHDMFQENFIDVITGLAAEYRLPVELLRLEITESAFSADTNTIKEIAGKLIAAGFTVEIDDFGSGYSSLNTLKDVPAQILKLDMRFFEQTGDAKRGGNIVESVVRMAKWLGMAVIAEGVEDKAQADYLKSIGCYYIQGYLYAKPVPAEEYEKRLNADAKETQLTRLQTLQNLDNNDFWDSRSMDTLIFNSYVGAACIMELNRGKVEMLRATDHFVHMLSGGTLDIGDVLAIDWTAHMDSRTICLFTDAVLESMETKETVSMEFDLHDLPKCPDTVILRCNLRAIATVGERILIYCLNENMTAQREAEEKEDLAVQKREQATAQMQAILDNVDVGVVASIHRNNVPDFLFASEKYYEILGYSREQYESEITDPYAVFAPEELHRVTDVFAGSDTHEVRGTMEVYMLRRDGSRRLMRDAYSTCRIVGIDEPVHLSIFRDITEEREAELREKRFADEISIVMENVNCGICAIDISSPGAPHFIFTNDQFYSVAGYTREQIRAEVKHFTDLVHPDDVEKVNGIIAGIVTTQAATTFDFRCIRRDGSIVFLNSSVSFAEITGYGKVAILVQTDITEASVSKQNMVEAAEKEHRLSAELRAMMADIPGGFVRFRVEPDQRYIATFCNDGFCKLLGMDFDSLMSRYGLEPMADVHPDDVAIVRAAILEMQQKGHAHSARYRLRNGSGDYVWVTAFGRFSMDQNGNTFLNLYYTDETINEKASRYREVLMDNLPWGTGAYVFHNGQMQLLYQNKSYWDLVGLHEDKFPDPAPMSAIHPDDVPMVMQKLAVAIEHHEDVICDIRLRHLALGYRPVRLVARIVPDESGGFLIVASFIPKEQVEMTYQQTLPHLLATIMEASDDYAFAKDKDLRYICCSPAFLALAGLKSERDVVGKTDFELFPADLAERFRTNDLALLASNKPMEDFDEPVFLPDGTLHDCRVSKYMMRDAAGTGIGIYGVSHVAGT